MLNNDGQESPMLYTAKFRENRSTGSGEEEFCFVN